MRVTKKSSLRASRASGLSTPVGLIALAPVYGVLAHLTHK
jgi:hypothetical protein